MSRKGLSDSFGDDIGFRYISQNRVEPRTQQFPQLKAGDSSKLAATFETIARLESVQEDVSREGAAFRLPWEEVRAGEPGKAVRDVVARLTHG